MDTPNPNTCCLDNIPIPSSLTNNQKVRAAIRALRNAQSPSTIQSKSEIVVRFITDHLHDTEWSTVACYRASDGEVILDKAIHWLHALKVRVLVPIVRSDTMKFSVISSGSKFRVGTFGIEEPEHLDIVDPSEIDLVFAPLVAFSSRGYRLGRGKGYYDRAFSDNNHTKFVGVGYDFQHSDEFTTHAQDKKLHAIVTESGWRNFQTEHSVDPQLV